MHTLSFPLDRETTTTAWIAPCAAASTGFLLLPALGIEARYYQRVLSELCERGFAAAVVDARGVGASHPRPSRRHDHDYVTRIDDLSSSLERLAPELNVQRLLLVGHSLGGQIALLHAARERVRPYAGIALVASVMPYFRAFPGQRWRLLARTQAVRACAQVLGYFPGHKLGFGGLEARSLMVDWSRAARRGRYVLRGRDQSAALASLRLPILSVTLAGDQFAPVAAAEHVRHMLAQAQHSWHHETGTGQKFALDHNRWPRQPEEIVRHIVAWADELARVDQATGT